MIKPAAEAAKTIREHAPDFTPELGLILGSGLGPVADEIENAISIPYADLYGFPPCGVAGHGGRLVLGYLKGVAVACLQGRSHFYEGISREVIMTPTRTLKLLGCEKLLITNSSGSINPDVTPGELVVINDHINFQFNSPLVGPNDEDFGPRFVGMENAYDPEIRATLHATAKTLGIDTHEGVYIGVLGPAFETPAEIRAFRTLGATVVGMSTLPEVITARHCGMRLAVVSVITNMAAGMSEKQLSHDVTLEGAKVGVKKLIQLILGLMEQWNESKLSV